MKKLLFGLFVSLAMLAIPLASFAGQVTISLEWDANVETYLAGYKAYVADAAGGPYTEFSDIKEPTTEVDYVYDAPDGVATTKYFVVTAYREAPFLESGNSNEVYMVYDFAPIVAATNLAAALDGDVITFTWNQGGIDRVEKWELYRSETPGTGYEPFLIIEYTGQAGPQYSSVIDMMVPEGELKTYYFVLVTFNPRGVFSENSNQVDVTIDKRDLAPVYNLEITVKAE